MSRYTAHKKRWMNCERCNLCEKRNKVVLARGKLPCDILFIGEAPGVSENTIGDPFIGPAGKLLDHIIFQAGLQPHGDSSSFRMAFTNLVACIPLDDEGNKAHEPSKESIDACKPRLREFYKIADPDMVVFVGSLSEKYAKGWISQIGRIRIRNGKTPLALCKIIHPAAILRMDISKKGLAIQRSVVTLSEHAEELVPF